MNCTKRFKIKIRGILAVVLVAVSICGCNKANPQKAVSSIYNGETNNAAGTKSQYGEINKPTESESQYDETKKPTEPETIYIEETRKSAYDYAYECGMGINLGNTFESFWEDKNNKTTGAQIIGSNTPRDYETCWGASVVTKEMIAGIKESGFNTLRIPVYWGNMMAYDKTFAINEEYMERVEEVADWALSLDMYVVINIHHYDEFVIKNHTKEETLLIMQSLWRQISEHFADKSDHLMFEGYNENVGATYYGEHLNEDEIYEYANRLNQVFVDTVRSVPGNEDRMLIVSGYYTNIDKTVDYRFVVPKDTADDRLMVSVHYIDNDKYWSRRIGSAEWVSYVDSQIAALCDRFDKEGIPVFVGECFSVYDNQYMAADSLYEDSKACLKLLLTKANDAGLVTCLWDTTDNFYLRSKCTVRSDEEKKIIQGIERKRNCT